MVALANSVVAAFYYLRIVYAMYLRPASDEAGVEVDGALGVSLGFATAAMLVMGFLPAPFLAAATAAAVSVTVVLP
jgi:NADH:ubiquinone oxidoreductase subunit 2 (subunit N)